jgi:tetratricopeptide (TPR) repeat protein
MVFGQPFVALRDIDFAFVEPPQKMEVPKGRKFVTKTHFEEVKAPPTQIFRAAANVQRAQALNYAEQHLRANSSDNDLLEAYLGTLNDAERPRGMAFLETGLDARPVLVTWHRAYQEMVQSAGRGDEVVPRYDHLLALEPNDARLLYLRGRLEVDRAHEDNFLRRSIAADPSFPWPWYALGGEAATRANWEESLACYNKAETLGLKSADLNAGKYTAELALGPAQSVIDSLRARVDANPTDLSTVAQLAEALVVARRAEEATKLVADFESRLPPEARHPMVPFLRGLVAYMRGDFSGSEESLRNIDHQQARLVRGHSLLCQSRVRDAAAAPELQSLWQDPENALALSLAFHLQGDLQQATLWRDKACDIWKSHGPRGRVQVLFLRQDMPPLPQQLEAVSFVPQSQIILLAVMGRQFPSAKAYLDAQAGKLNVRRFPPFHLVQQAIRADAR